MPSLLVRYTQRFDKKSDIFDGHITLAEVVNLPPLETGLVPFQCLEVNGGACK